MRNGSNGTRQILDVPAAGAWLPVVATGPLRHLLAFESLYTAEGAANVPQGLQYRLGNDGTAAGFTRLFATVPPAQMNAVDPGQSRIELGDPQASQTQFGSLLGNGPDEPAPGARASAATILFYVSSATALATAIEVRQDY